MEFSNMLMDTVLFMRRGLFRDVCGVSLSASRQQFTVVRSFRGADCLGIDPWFKSSITIQIVVSIIIAIVIVIIISLNIQG